MGRAHKNRLCQPCRISIREQLQVWGGKMLELIHDGIMREGYQFVESFVIELIKAKSCET